MRVRRRPSVRSSSFLPPGLSRRPRAWEERGEGGRASPVGAPRFFGSRLLPVHRRGGSSAPGRDGARGARGWEPRRRPRRAGPVARRPPSRGGLAARVPVGRPPRGSGPRASFLLSPPHGSTSRPRVAGGGRRGHRGRPRARPASARHLSPVGTSGVDQLPPASSGLSRRCLHVSRVDQQAAAGRCGATMRGRRFPFTSRRPPPASAFGGAGTTRNSLPRIFFSPTASLRPRYF